MSASPSPPPSDGEARSRVLNFRAQLREIASGKAWPVALALGLFLGGFGTWGAGVWGDNALDLADSLRVFQGDVPYRDFVPTYGPLHLASAPLFALGRAFFPSYWSATFLLVVAQMLAIMGMVRRRNDPFWTAMAALLFLACVAFAPINAQLMQGYSASGFLGTLGWTLVLWLLWSGENPRGSSPWFTVGAILGLQPFTKMDTGLTACAVLVALSIVLGTRQKHSALRMLAGFLASWAAILLGLVAWGGSPRLILESGLEGMGQATIFGDVVLKQRIEALFLGGAMLTLALALPSLRRKLVRLQRELRPWLIWLLPFALLIDGIRGWPSASLKNMVALHYLCVLVWVLVTARLGAALLRWRSLRALRFRSWPALLAMWVIVGVGIARVSITGWYPLNYCQPSTLLLLLLWFGTRSTQRGFSRSVYRGTLACTALLCLALVIQRLACPIHMVTRIETPFGEIPISMDPVTRHDLATILEILNAASPGETLLCTYEPSAQLLTGMRSAAFYTYFARVGFSGQYQPVREARALEFFMQRRPRFVLWDKERASFSRFFGHDHSLALARWIEVHYEPVHISPAESRMQVRLYARRD